MELSATKGGGFLINSSNASLLVDPNDGEVANAVLFMDPNNPRVEQDFGEALVISGAGEYEVGDFVIHGEADEKGVFYTIEGGGEKLLLVNASDVASLSSDMRFGTVVVRLDGAFDVGSASTLPGELIVLYGPSENTTEIKVERMDKIGKRKKSELVGQTILLSK